MQPAISQGLQAAKCGWYRPRFSGQVPGLIPSQMRIVQQDAHQFRDSHRRMGIIQLNRNFFRQVFQSVL